MLMPGLGLCNCVNSRWIVNYLYFLHNAKFVLYCFLKGANL